MLPPPGSLYPGLPQWSLPSSVPYSFPYYKSILPRQFRSTVGAVISLSFPVGVYPTVGSSVITSIFSLSLSLSTNPPSTRTPRDCLNPWLQSEQQGFSSALTRLLAMTAIDNHSLHAHTLVWQPSVHVTLQQAISKLSPIGRSGTSNPGGMRWSPHLLPSSYT